MIFNLINSNYPQIFILFLVSDFTDIQTEPFKLILLVF